MPRHTVRKSGNRRRPPLVCLFKDGPSRLGDLGRALLAVLKRRAADAGQPFRVIHMRGRPAAAVWREVKALRPWGLILGTIDMDMLDLAIRSGLPATLVGDWAESIPLDSVMQNDFQGGLFAGRYLASRGHKRIAWFGPPLKHIQGHLRFSGAVTGLREAGKEFDRRSSRFTLPGRAPAEALAVLRSRRRPTAVVALWQSYAMAFARAMRRLELVLGRDVEMVGWAREDQYDSSYRRAFRGGAIPPAIAWNLEDMAEMVFSRLSERRRSPGSPTTHIRIPVRIRFDRDLTPPRTRG